METITGSIERITFQNEENGYSVVKVRAKGYREVITLVGALKRAINKSKRTKERLKYYDKNYFY